MNYAQGLVVRETLVLRLIAEGHTVEEQAPHEYLIDGHPITLEVSGHHASKVTSSLAIGHGKAHHKGMPRCCFPNPTGERRLRVMTNYVNQLLAEVPHLDEEDVLIEQDMAAARARSEEHQAVLAKAPAALPPDLSVTIKDGVVSLTTSRPHTLERLLEGLAALPDAMDLAQALHEHSEILRHKENAT